MNYSAGMQYKFLESYWDMNNKNIRIGLDRYLDREWVDYALELALNSDDVEINYDLIKIYLEKQIAGSESARKTANQLRRLWILCDDEKSSLRCSAKEIIRKRGSVDYRIFHFGMALNVFPIFLEVCKKLGDLSKLPTEINRNLLAKRVAETYLNPSSIPRVVSRVIQTLENWEFIELKGSTIQLREISIEDPVLGEWFLQALVMADRRNRVTLNATNLLPEQLGVKISGIRELIRSSENWRIQRTMDQAELIIPNGNNNA